MPTRLPPSPTLDPVDRALLGDGSDAAERAARDHAFDGLFKHALGEATTQDLVRGDFLDAAGIAGVLVIGLVLELVARQPHLVNAISRAIKNRS